MLIVFWIILTLIVGFIGSSRKIGFFGAFLLSLFLSPLIGGIITLCSKSLADEEHEKKMLAEQKKQTDLLKNQNNAQTSISDELSRIGDLKEKGLITEDEYIKLKEKIINGQ